MLYERWRQIARSYSGEIALRDLASHRQWTFRELEIAAERSHAEEAKIAFPTGLSADFVLNVLRAWRLGQIVCPVEADQQTPEIGAGLPAEIAHLKMTSGTTAVPRFVAFAGAQLMADAENIVATMGLRP